MLIVDCIQGDPVWHEARMGIPTASAFNRILTPAKLTPSSQSDAYLDELLAEWLLDRSSDFGGNFWTDRGKEMEPLARAWYALEYDIDVHSVGFIYKDASRTVGCSPDGFVADTSRGIEMKCPKASTHIGYLRRGGIPREYRLQVQGSMWVTGMESWDFLSYHPELPPLCERAEPEQQVQAAFDEHIPAFIDALDKARGQLIDMGMHPDGYDRAQGAQEEGKDDAKS